MRRSAHLPGFFVFLGRVKKKELAKGKNSTRATTVLQGPHARWAHSQKRLPDRRPKSDVANAFAAAHDNAAHLLLHATSTLPLNSSGAPCALCCDAKNWLFWQTIDLRPRQQGRRPWPAPLHMQIRVCPLFRLSPPRVLRLVAAVTTVASIANWALQTGTTLLRRLLDTHRPGPFESDNSTSANFDFGQ